jgi:hypothetical protein
MRVPPSFTGLASAGVAAIVRVGVLERALADVVLERPGCRRHRGRHREASKEKIWARGQQPRGRRSSCRQQPRGRRLSWLVRSSGGMSPFLSGLGRPERRPGKKAGEGPDGYRRIMETRFWDSSGCTGVGSRRVGVVRA